MSSEQNGVRYGISPYQHAENEKAAAYRGASRYLDDPTLIALLMQRFATFAAAQNVIADAKTLLTKVEQSVDGRCSAIDHHISLLDRRMEAMEQRMASIAVARTPTPRRRAKPKKRRR